MVSEQAAPSGPVAPVGTAVSQTLQVGRCPCRPPGTAQVSYPSPCGPILRPSYIPRVCHTHV